MRRLFAAIALLSSCATTTPATGPDAPATPHLSDAECVIWERDLAFGQTVIDRNLEAFAEFLEPDAVFSASALKPRRGKEQIVEHWKPMVTGQTITVRWYPTMVVMGGAPDVAFSSGPVLISNNSYSKRELSIGRYQSVWHKGADGVWRVLFDDGSGSHEVTPQEAQAFTEARQEKCPR